MKELTLAILVLGTVRSHSVAATDCPPWGRFEVAFTNAKAYPDPYRDVSLEATFARPDGRTVQFWGFHDGGQVWRLRFMPDRPGTWRYEAAFSDGTKAGSGQLVCVQSNRPGPIAVYQANPVWFGHRNGDAVLIRGFHVGDRFFAANIT